MADEKDPRSEPWYRHLLYGGRFLDLLLAVGGYLISQIRYRTWPWVLLGATVIAAAFLRAWIRERLKERQVLELAEQLSVTLGDVVTPIAHLIGRIACASKQDRGGLQGQLKQKIVDSAADLCGIDRTRATFFEIDGPDVMKPVAHSGRIDAPRTTFRRGEERGAQAFRLVDEQGQILVLDTQDPPEGVVIRQDAPYRTFLAATVSAEDQNFGMLTVDCVVPGDLNQADLDVARALAQLLGAGLTADVG